MTQSDNGEANNSYRHTLEMVDKFGGLAEDFYKLKKWNEAHVQFSRAIHLAVRELLYLAGEAAVARAESETRHARRHLTNLRHMYAILRAVGVDPNDVEDEDPSEDEEDMTPNA
ncbi:MAG TPA: hypothetical protein VG942_12350 [Hyphomonadaceae bacterium]|nr:hypothetical protein [Hyphomonadaceae bacterium]